MLDAARIAGFASSWDITDPRTGKSTQQSMRLLSEPVAVALAAARDRKEPGVVTVVNFGTGYFDVAVLEVGDGVFEVKATGGAQMSGGTTILSDPIIEKYRTILLETLRAAGLNWDSVEEVFLSGWMRWQPRVRQLVRETFGREGVE